MSIYPERLLELRTRMKFSRQELANKSKVSPRQIARLESGSVPSDTARESTINRLAKALKVEPGVLIGEIPMPEAIPPSGAKTGERVQLSALVMPEQYLQYALIKRQYGINPTTLFHAAPMMFALLAESSFMWRREKLKEIEEAADQLHDLGIGHLSFAKGAADRARAGAYHQNKSIEKGDFFGDDISSEGIELRYDHDTNNPFADYLFYLAEKINNPDVVDVHDESAEMSGPLKNFPRVGVCDGELSMISGGSMAAKAALEGGYVRINDIPDELWADDAKSLRANWLKDHLPEKQKELYERLSNPFDLPEADQEEAGQ